MNTDESVDESRRKAVELALHPRLAGFSALLTLASFVLIGVKLISHVHLSWWWIAATFGGGAVLWFRMSSKGVALEATPESMRKAFEGAGWGQSGSLTYRVQERWKRTRLEAGVWRFYISELSDLVSVTIESKWLHQSEITTLEQYERYDKQFTEKELGGRRLEWRFTKRWGVDAYESSYIAKGMSGLRLVVPYHGTEHHIMVIAPLPEHLPAMKLAYEEFIRRAEFRAIPTTLVEAFSGQMRIGIPTGYRKTSSLPEEEHWEISALNLSARISLRRVGSWGASELTKEGLRTHAPDSLRGQLRDGASKLHIKESGASGFVTYGSYDATRKDADARHWFAAMFGLPLGSRLFLCLEETKKTDASYYSGFHYVQAMFDVIASIRECPTGGDVISFEEESTASSAALNAIRHAKETNSAKLVLDEQELEIVPEEIGELTELKELSLRKNQLTVLPEAIGQLVNLEVLHVSGNRLTALPAALTRLTRLRILGVSTNQVEALPQDIGDMRSLEEIHAGGNRLTSLPASLGKLRGLVKLNACNNNLSSLPRELCDCPALKFLYLHDNPALALSESDLGPSWTDVRMGASPKSPKSIVESWLRRQG